MISYNGNIWNMSTAVYPMDWIGLRSAKTTQKPFPKSFDLYVLS